MLGAARYVYQTGFPNLTGLGRLTQLIGALAGEISMGSRFCDDDVVLGSRTDCSISKQRAAHTAHNDTPHMNSVDRPQYLCVPSQLDTRIIQRLTRLQPRICHPLCTDNVPSPPDRERAAE